MPKVQPPVAVPTFSPEPSDAEITRARLFAEPLVPIGDRANGENSALARALEAYLKAGAGENVAPLLAFLNQYPGSAWRASLLTDLGLVYRRTGYFLRALDAWEEAWRLSKGATDPIGAAIGDAALAELAELNARLGRYDRLEALFAETKDRDIRGSATEKISGARGGLWLMRNKPEEAFRCGPMAIDRILAYGRANYRRDTRLSESRSSLQGMSLVQIRGLAKEVGLDAQMAKRDPGAEFLYPAVLHWKAGHYAALIKREGDRYLVQDPTFGDDTWVSRRALEEESSGFALVPTGQLPAGWRSATAAEGSEVWGKGTTIGPTPQQQGANNQTTAPSCSNPTCPCMAGYAVHTMMVNLTLIDTPVGYSPPVGPSLDFTVRYNQRDVFQPQVFYYSNFGPKWTTDWISYIEDDPSTPSANVNLYGRGGGQETYSGFNPTTQTYAPHFQSHAFVVRTSSSPIQYERRLPDGSKEVFGQPDGSLAFPRKVLMTDWVDAQGNGVHITWDSSLRIVSFTDAIGQVTTLSYDLSADPLKVTKVTDPFGRFATFEYNSQGRLQRITDVIGLTSDFTYTTQDRIDSLTTPYGTTKFAFGDAGRDRWIEITDPLGGRERLEYRNQGPIPTTEPAPAGFDSAQFLDYRNTYYWDKRAMMVAAGDYTKAHVFHWLHGGADFNMTSEPLESEKKPLENRVWYQYANQPNYAAVGSSASPTRIGRILDDGTTQTYRYEYGPRGNKTKEIDPLGRETIYEYGTDDTDLLRTKQKNGGSYDLIETRTYNAQHLPVTLTDAAGQTTTFTYNTAGQILTGTTPPRAGTTENRTTTYVYDPDGYVQSVTRPASGATTSYAYDGYGRARTITDPEGYAVTTDFDVLDRPTKITYPDGTYEQISYSRLDVEQRRDRLGRSTHTFYDALRRLVAIRDPLGRTVTQQWCICGSLEKVIDANIDATGWERDLQGRITKETRADGAQWLYTYEATTSRLRQITDARTQSKIYDYFLDNNVKQVAYPNAVIPTATVSYTYDPAYNRMLTMVDGVGTTTYSYNPITSPAQFGAGQVANVDGPFADDTVSYTYDELGRVLTRGLTGATSTFGFDALGRVSSQAHPIGTWTFGYAGVTNRLATATYPNNQTASYTYFGNTGDHRLQQIKHQAPGGGVISQYDYTYDAVGELGTWKQQPPSGAAKIYNLGYDPANQLTSARLQTTDPTPALLKRYGYAYDAAGNRTAEQIDDTVTAASYNNRNQLTSHQAGGTLLFRGSVNEPATVTIAGKPAQMAVDNTFVGQGSVSSGTSNVVVAATDASGNTRTNTYQVNQSGSTVNYAYDANGNLSSKTEGATITTYEWDGENRLAAVKQGPTTLASFVYDGSGRRVIKTASGLTRTYVFDAANIVEERLSTGATTRYVHGVGIDRPLAMQDGTGVISFFLRDHLDSVVQATDTTGAVTLSREYDPYGNLMTGASTAGYGYTARDWDAETGLDYLRARYYDPKDGRFLSEDPIGFEGGINFYAYVANNPVNWADPHGLCPCTECPSGQWELLGRVGGTAGAAIGSLAVGATVTYGTFVCVGRRNVTRGAKITCKITGGVFAGVGVGAQGTTTTMPVVSGVRCKENLAPFSFREKFFSIGPFGGNAPPQKIMPSSVSIGKSWGLGSGSLMCYAEPQ